MMMAMPTGIVTRLGMVTGTIDHTTPLVQPLSRPSRTRLPPWKRRACMLPA